ncbi:hypothetical protein NC797_12380 [Aquibacillus sp. 3ASR75-11]|uniref:Uncharacterized protein n=1 Tax=Terrihalobacillus insolitus TaxID=2950438 RepID=A0A9X3WT21_9BACI|nr:SA1362 family protein [Terrihalobacillus insolitus]MDC3414417.1 hypothetical protein [Terrihalobacillus insolitus]MDC3425297.1 hypothetical protein [Terrihalobacillus insolitus]
MIRHKLSLFVYLLIGLAIFGFVTQLATNTTSLLSSLVMMAAIGAAMYGLVYFFFLRKRTSNEMRKYKKAVRQTKKKYKNDVPSKKTLSHTIKKKAPLTQKSRLSKTRPTHLKVIEGNKQKRKNRATF